MVSALWENRSLLAENSWVTLREILFGFSLAVLTGLVFAIFLHLSETMRRAAYPLLVASQTIPILALAPIFVVLFGYGEFPKLAIIALVCFFPITVGTLDGLRSVSGDAVKLMLTLDANRWQTFRRVEAPTALPNAFTGAKIAVSFAPVVALFAEWIGASSGLGHLILIDNGQLETARMFAAIAILAVIGLALFGLPLSQSGSSSLGDRTQGMKQPRIPALALAIALLALAVGLAACGKKSEDTTGERQPFSLDPRLLPQPGSRRDLHGAEARLLRRSRPRRLDRRAGRTLGAAQGVAAGRSDLAITYEPEVALAREQGLDVVAVAALVNRPLTSLIWLRKSGIKSVPDLKGKTVSYAGIPYQEAFLETILARAKLAPGDVKSVNVGFGLLPARWSAAAAQAMLGGYTNVEGVDLRERGKEPVITPVDQLGVPTYDELVLVARRKDLEEDPEKIRLFIAALLRGTDAAVEKPNEATEAILEANSGLEPKLTKAEIAATLPLLAGRTQGKPFGYMDPAEWEAFAAWMRDEELIETLPDSGELLTNAYLVGEIPE